MKKITKRIISSTLLIIQSIIASFVLIHFAFAASSESSETQKTDSVLVKSGSLPVYAAYISEELEEECSTAANRCNKNPIEQKEYEASVAQLEVATKLTDGYELLVGSAVITRHSDTMQSLVLEFTLQWHGIPIHEAQNSIVIEGSGDSLSSEIASSMQLWQENVIEQKAFSASYLHTVLGVSNYEADLVLPQQVGSFELIKQHLNSDPFSGVLSRYTHTDFDLAVLDIYVYPLTTTSNIESQLISELTNEQNDIKLLSAAFGKDALDISAIRKSNDLSQSLGVASYYFEATLTTDTEPLFVTQYAFVKEDKIIKFSANMPLRIAKPVVLEAASQIEVPQMSAFMAEVRGPLFANTFTE